MILALLCLVPAIAYFLGVATGLVFGGEAAPVSFLLRYFIGNTSLASFVVLVAGAAVSAVLGLVSQGRNSAPRRFGTVCGYLAATLLMLDVPSFLFQLHLLLVFRT